MAEVVVVMAADLDGVLGIVDLDMDSVDRS